MICITTLLPLSQLCRVKWKNDNKEDSRRLSRKVIQIIARKCPRRLDDRNKMLQTCPTHRTLLGFVTLIMYIEKLLLRFSLCCVLCPSYALTA